MYYNLFISFSTKQKRGYMSILNGISEKNRERALSSENTMSEGVYNFSIGAVLCWGFFVNWMMIKTIPAESIMSMNIWALLIGFFVLGIAGVVTFSMSSNPVISFIGYNMVVVAFGLTLNVIISEHDPDTVFQAMQTTGLVTAVMMFLGSLFPKFFKKLFSILLISLLVMIVVELIQTFVFHVHQGWTDLVVALIFCGWIGYDWAKANEVPRTLDNAIDGAAALYMDIINLFSRILNLE